MNLFCNLSGVGEGMRIAPSPRKVTHISIGIPVHSPVATSHSPNEIILILKLLLELELPRSEVGVEFILQCEGIRINPYLSQKHNL